MRRTKLFILLSFLILFSILLLLSFNMLGLFTCKDYLIQTVPKTYRIESELVKTIGKNSLLLNRREIKKSILNNPYIKEVDLKLNKNTVIIDGEISNDGLIIVSDNSSYFYSDSLLSELDYKDIYALKDYYIVLNIDKETLLFIQRYGISDELLSLLSSLSHESSLTRLITRAEYDNNNSSIFSGSLYLYLDQFEAILIIEDIREIDKIKEAILFIEKNYNDSKNRLNGERKKYLLSSSQLIEMR